MSGAIGSLEIGVGAIGAGNVTAAPAQSSAIPQYTAANYLSAFLNALPRGRAWPKSLGSVCAQVLAGLAPSYVRNNGDAIALIKDAFPATTVNLLPEWELSLGLPDPCDTDTQTLAVRQANVVARFAYNGGQSIRYFVGLAAALGYKITISEFSHWVFGMPFGMPMTGDGWTNVWQVNSPTFSVKYFTFGASNFGEAFATWGTNSLQCTLRRLAPAHTTVLFSYS
jgi:uncharacterized protein YmfQ (DUF2313 family)